MPNNKILTTQNNPLTKVEKQLEGLYLLADGNQIVLGYRFDSAISRITPILLIGLIILGILSYHTSRIYEFLGVLIFSLISCLFFLWKKEHLFYKSEVALKLKKIEKFGDSKKGLLNIEDAQIFQPTTRQKNISAKARIINQR